MKKIVIITDAPSPYRVDFFVFLQETYTEYEWNIIFCNRSSRKWNSDYQKICNHFFLGSLKIKYSTKLDRRFLVISYGVTRLLNKIQPDVIVASEYNQTVQVAFTWAQKKRKKFVSWTDGTIRSEQNFKKIRLLMRKRIIRKADSFIASSSSSRDLQIKYGANPQKCHISFLTVKTDSYKVKPHTGNNGRFQILFVGRLVKGKGLNLLLNALRRVEGNYKLVVAGDGPEEVELRSLVSKYKMDNIVEFKGFCQRETLKELYSRSQLFVLPTLNDCFGLVILEAMCASLPVITTIYADGAPDLIDNGVSGVIIDPYDEKLFANTIQKFVDNEEYASEMGKRGYERSDIFHFKNVSKGFVDAIECALGEKMQ